MEALEGTWNDDNSTGGLDGNIFNATNVIPGNYDFTYIIDGGICTSDSVTVVISVVNYGTDGCIEYVDFFIPEGFSPNGDGINEMFMIDGIENFNSVEVFIYNRWGNEVYHSDNYNNNWNGHAQNAGILGDGLLPVGIYYYIIYFNGNDKPEKGYVYIQY